MNNRLIKRAKQLLSNPHSIAQYTAGMYIIDKVSKKSQQKYYWNNFLKLGKYFDLINNRGG